LDTVGTGEIDPDAVAEVFELEDAGPVTIELPASGGVSTVEKMVVWVAVTITDDDVIEISASYNIQHDVSSVNVLASTAAAYETGGTITFAQGLVLWSSLQSTAQQTVVGTFSPGAGTYNFGIAASIGTGVGQGARDTDYSGITL